MALRKKFKFIEEIYTRGGVWSDGYFVSTIGLNEGQIRKYIDSQNQYDLPRDVTNEFS